MCGLSSRWQITCVAYNGHVLLCGYANDVYYSLLAEWERCKLMAIVASP